MLLVAEEDDVSRRQVMNLSHTGTVRLQRTAITRWEDFYREDARIPTTPPSVCARRAAALYRQHKICTVVDLGCGVGRDTYALARDVPFIVGVDAALSGLSIARQTGWTNQRTVPFVQADARRLPFRQSSVDGVYCYGLLHEFASETAANDVARVMENIAWILKPAGILILTMLAGEPEAGLPHVRLFNEIMVGELIKDYGVLEQETYRDIGCTGSTDYRVHYGAYIKLHEMR